MIEALMMAMDKSPPRALHAAHEKTGGIHAAQRIRWTGDVLLVVTHPVRLGHMTLPSAAHHAPAGGLPRRPGGTLARRGCGSGAVRSEEEWTVRAEDLHSRSNSAFIGHRVFGSVKHVLVGGVNVTATRIGV
jgi:dihydroorotase-like cyclic amidohydrolase